VTHDPNNPEQVQARKLTDRALAKQAEDDLAWVLGDARGQRVLASIVAQCGVSRLSFVAGDPMATAFNEGRRSVGIWLSGAFPT
jgi:hypothetical protein